MKSALKYVTTEKELRPLQPGDVPDTFTDVQDLVRDSGYRPAMTVEPGIEKFVGWFLEYYR